MYRFTITTKQMLKNIFKLCTWEGNSLIRYIYIYKVKLWANFYHAFQTKYYFYHLPIVGGGLERKIRRPQNPKVGLRSWDSSSPKLGATSALVDRCLFWGVAL
jgi:hypothetical protein